jgi:hypothetical protein
MKIYGFENTVPAPGDGRKRGKSVNPQEHNSTRSAGVNRRFYSILPRGSIRTWSVNPQLDNNGLGEIHPVGPRRIEYVHNTGNGNEIDLRRNSPGIVFGLDRVLGELSGSGSDSRDSRLSKIRQNITAGYYNSPEFIEKLADTLIEKLRLAGDGK